jgi:hypothetical protein
VSACNNALRLIEAAVSTSVIAVIAQSSALWRVSQMQLLHKGLSSPIINGGLIFPLHMHLSLILPQSVRPATEAVSAKANL